MRCLASRDRGVVAEAVARMVVDVRSIVVVAFSHRRFFQITSGWKNTAALNGVRFRSRSGDDRAERDVENTLLNLRRAQRRDAA